MDARDGRPGVHKLGSLFVAVALVPAMVGFATEYWLLGDSDSRHVGLWKVCGDKDCRSLHTENIPEWYNAARGLSVFALCLHFMSVVTGCCCACLETHEPNVFFFVRRLEEVAAVLAGGLMGAALAVFAQASSQHPVFCDFAFDWSFWLILTDLFFLFIGGALVFMSRRDCVGRRLGKDKGYSRQALRADDRQMKSPIYRGHDFDFERNVFPKKSGFLPVDKAENASSLQRNFLERLKTSHTVHSFNSLEGIPRALQKLTLTNDEKNTSDSLFEDV
ncbi:hypothetical protein BaRGS_00001161 [Batillaria attramentaria]|uniref:Uncharacterized protein n=1 Tax=Batillaria attramentaria TaxID=370345 RepID=A0ABD0M787_9CAEN|nr:hypothetical protein BaRGS_000250 [Batillaria attramentaria]